MPLVQGIKNYKFQIRKMVGALWVSLLLVFITAHPEIGWAGAAEEAAKLEELRQKYLSDEKSVKETEQEIKYYHEKQQEAAEELKVSKEEFFSAKLEFEKAQRDNRNNPTPENDALLKKAEFAFNLAERAVNTREKKVERYGRNEFELRAKAEALKNNLSKQAKLLKDQKTLVATLRAQKLQTPDEKTKEKIEAPISIPIKSPDTAKIEKPTQKQSIVDKNISNDITKEKVAASAPAQIVSPSESSGVKPKIPAVKQPASTSQPIPPIAGVSTEKSSQSPVAPAVVAVGEKKNENEKKAPDTVEAASAIASNADKVAVQNEPKSTPIVEINPVKSAEKTLLTEANTVAKKPISSQQISISANDKIEIKEKEHVKLTSSENKPELVKKTAEVSPPVKKEVVAIGPAVATSLIDPMTGLPRKIEISNSSPKDAEEKLKTNLPPQKIVTAAQPENPKPNKGVAIAHEVEAVNNSVDPKKIAKNAAVVKEDSLPTKQSTNNPAATNELGVATAKSSSNSAIKNIGQQQVALIQKASLQATADMSEEERLALLSPYHQKMTLDARAELDRLDKLLRGRDLGEPPYIEDVELQGSHLPVASKGKIFKFLGNNQYRLETQVAAGQQEFKVDSSRWKYEIPAGDAGAIYVFILDAKRIEKPALFIYKKSLIAE